MKLSRKQLIGLIKEEIESFNNVAEEIENTQVTSQDIKRAEQFMSSFKYTSTALDAIYHVYLQYGDDDSANLIYSILPTLAQIEAKTL